MGSLIGEAMFAFSIMRSVTLSICRSRTAVSVSGIVGTGGNDSTTGGVSGSTCFGAMGDKGSGVGGEKESGIIGRGGVERLAMRGVAIG